MISDDDHNKLYAAWSRLNPCPCGDDKDNLALADAGWYAQVSCPSCARRTEMKRMVDEAVDAWNRQEYEQRD